MLLGVEPQHELKLQEQLEFLLNYLSSDYLFYSKNEDYAFTIKYIDNIIYFHFLNSKNNEESVFYFNNDKKLSVRSDLFTYQALSSDNTRFHFYYTLNGQYFSIFAGSPVKNANVLSLKDKKYSILNDFYFKQEKISKILKILDKNITNFDYSSSNIKPFLKDIDLTNYQTYRTLINNNINNLKNLTLTYTEAKKLNIDFFKLTKEDKELLMLNSDLSINFNVDTKKTSNRIFSFFKK